MAELELDSLPWRAGNRLSPSWKKFKKYESYLCSPLTRLGQIRDPRIGNGSGMELDMMQTIRDILTEEYGLSSAEPTGGVSDKKTCD
jgi:hypothetical protein